jgi:hypothetical protein
MFRLSLIFFFFLALQPLGARDKHAVHAITGKGSLSSYASLSFKHESFPATVKSFKSVYLKKKKRRNKGTKLSSVRVSNKPLALPFSYRRISFLFSRELIVTSCSATPPHRGPPSMI